MESFILQGARQVESIDRIEPIPDIFFHPLVEKLKMYFICGGFHTQVLCTVFFVSLNQVYRSPLMTTSPRLNFILLMWGCCVGFLFWILLR